ncbi:slipin family protein [Bacillus sp. BRMEA1]|uniref:SPFH domain-containing protein n=1 Tax=Neobacillus endophyticus TaxID=2738405 RepID=UPI00156494EF|nr:SPFH domain-containing protein [Neobacillus endophyticus]NRD76537.1 slipin family protein [Neobacillus endophyticus]
MSASISVLLTLAVLVVLLFLSSIRIVQQYQQGVVLRLGRYTRSLEPGVQFVIPLVDSVRRIDMRIRVENVENQDIITKDSVPVTLNAVVYYQAVNAQKALLDVEDYRKATRTLAQTILRSNLGAHTMQEMLTDQKKLDDLLRSELDRATEPWGIKVTGVEIRSMDLPEGLRRAMAKEAEAERERKAKVIAAQGEFEAAEKLAEAATVISKQPEAMQLRMLQTMTEIAAEKNSTILFPYDAASGLASLFRKSQEQ